MATARDNYLVIGGSGFVGRHIVQQLLARGDTVSVLDIVQRYHDTPFYSADISEQQEVAAALQKSGATCVIHTASPHAGLNDAALYFKVNVDGTKAIIAACVQQGVTKLVFTSSAGVIFDGGDIINADERTPLPETPLDAYNESKAKAEEAVLQANGIGGLWTVALRPAGIFGPGDRQVMSGLFQVYDRGQTHFQIGDNTNLFDWTYVGNVAKAHLLAADKLGPPKFPRLELTEDHIPVTDIELTAEEEKFTNYTLPYVSKTAHALRIPTSEARPLGPCVEPPVNARELEQAYAEPEHPQNRPVIRTRFDALAESSIARHKLTHDGASPLDVCGQVFFITNGEPVYFWDFPRAVWKRLDKLFPGKRTERSVWKLSQTIGLTAATGSEWVGWMTGKEPTFTRFKVSYSCAVRWHNIEKARRVLGYEPDVGIEEGLDRLLEWWASEHGHLVLSEKK
ncbi:C-3 sterol dehydrogenase [Pterulicium gracile]|uniref:C-3 sterol dehydrogenase n=1 Tax=Pterulicium gracile TaxID=1884261 RepID=A0A5C3QKI7_9AGAR|nr:C-3 sterol dehydrogenase [Pterula gracilis]